MRVCFPSKDENPTLDSEPEPVFGNAKSYLLIGDDPDDIIVLKNPQDPEMKHMGDEFLKYNVKSIVSKDLCDGCMEELNSRGIDVWETDDSVNIREAFDKYLMGADYSRKKADIDNCEHSVDEMLSKY